MLYPTPHIMPDPYCRIAENPRNRVCHCKVHYATHKSKKHRDTEIFMGPHEENVKAIDERIKFIRSVINFL